MFWRAFACDGDCCFSFWLRLLSPAHQLCSHPFLIPLPPIIVNSCQFPSPFPSIDILACYCDILIVSVLILCSHRVFVMLMLFTPLLRTVVLSLLSSNLVFAFLLCYSHALLVLVILFAFLLCVWYYCVRFPLMLLLCYSHAPLVFALLLCTRWYSHCSCDRVTIVLLSRSSALYLCFYSRSSFARATIVIFLGSSCAR